MPLKGCPKERGPLDIQLVLDSSGSMESHWADVIEELQTNFIDLIMTHEKSRMAISKFGTTYETIT